MKKILSILLPLLFLCISCIRDVVLKLDPVPPVLVLNASITPEREVAAFLSKSWFLLDSVPEYDLPDKGVNIDVFVNDTFRGSMQRSDNPADSTEYKGQFKLSGCHVKAGDKVRLEAGVSGFDPVAAETVIPQKTDIILLDTVGFLKPNSFSSHLLRMYITLHDKPAERNYYRLVVEQLVEFHKGDSVMWVSTFCDEIWRNTITGDDLADTFDNFSFYGFRLTYDDPVFQPDIPSLAYYDGPYCRGIFPDDLFNGKDYTVTASFTPNYSFVTDTLSATVHYDVHLLSISEAYYNYLKVIRNFSIPLGDANIDALLEPISTYSNVTDGFGVVTGYQKATRRITMPIGSVPPYFEW